MLELRQPDDPRFALVFLRRELIDQGWHDRGIANMVRSGLWVRVRHGAYVDGAAWRALDRPGKHEVRMRAVLKQSQTRLVASHVSGVSLYDAPTWGLDLSSVHGTRVDGKAGRAEAGVRQHRGKILDGDVVTRHDVEVMSATRLALEVTTVASTEASLVVTNHLLHHKETDPTQLRARYALGIDRWSDTLRTDLVLRLADGRCESVGESRTFYLLYAHGLPAPIPQYEIRDPEGNVVARVDFAWPELGVFLEFDGKIKYQKLLKAGESATDVVLREKRREEMICELTGWRCIRVIWAELEQPEFLAARIRRVLFSLAIAR
jgi:hypothetical protein